MKSAFKRLRRIFETSYAKVLAKQNIVLFICVVVFILLPGKRFLLMDGLPLNALLEIFSVIALALLFFVFPVKKIEPKWLTSYIVIFVCLSMLKIAIGLITPTNGLYAKYFANPFWEGKYERSTEFISLKNATRIDSQINFHNVGYSYRFINIENPLRIGRRIDFRNLGLSISGMPFPLDFFNDHKRFNYYGESAYLRRDPPFSVQWNAYLFIPQGQEYIFAIETMDSVWGWIDGNEIYSGRAGLRTVYLAKGCHKLEIRFSHLEAMIG